MKLEAFRKLKAHVEANILATESLKPKTKTTDKVAENFDTDENLGSTSLIPAAAAIV